MRRSAGVLEQKYDGKFTVVFDAIRQLMDPPPAVKKKFGFDAGKEDSGKRIEGQKKR